MEMNERRRLGRHNAADRLAILERSQSQTSDKGGSPGDLSGGGVGGGGPGGGGLLERSFSDRRMSERRLGRGERGSYRNGERREQAGGDADVDEGEAGGRRGERGGHESSGSPTNGLLSTWQGGRSGAKRERGSDTDADDNQGGAGGGGSNDRPCNSDSDLQLLPTKRVTAGRRSAAKQRVRSTLRRMDVDEDGEVEERGRVNGKKMTGDDEEMMEAEEMDEGRGEGRREDGGGEEDSDAESEESEDGRKSLDSAVHPDPPTHGKTKTTKEGGGGTDGMQAKREGGAATVSPKAPPNGRVPGGVEGGAALSPVKKGSPNARRAPRPLKVDLSKLQTSSLRRYTRVYKLGHVHATCKVRGRSFKATQRGLF